MAGKQMNQLSTLSTVADSDLLLVYDVDEGGSEKTKSITYAEFETQISGAVGGGGSNPESLYYNDIDIKVTAISTGISITDGTDVSTIGYNGPANALTITNTHHGGGVYMYAENASGVNNIVFFGDGDGASRLYYAGAQTLFTRSDGFYFQGGGDQGYLGITTDVTLHNHVHGGMIILNGEQTDGTNVQLGVFDPDGAAELYYAGIKSLNTEAEGIKIYDTSGSIPKLKFYSDASANLGYFTIHSTGMSMRDEVNARYIMTSNSSNQISFYGEDKQAMRTSQFGISIGEGNGVDHSHISGDFSVWNRTAGGSYRIAGRNSGDTISPIMANFDPDGAASLYYANAQKLYTTTNGITLIANSTYLDFYLGTAAYIKSFSHGGTLELKGETTGGSTVTFFKGDPDGAAELYHAGVSTIKTYVAGGVIQGFEMGDFTSSGATHARTTFYQNLGEFVVTNFYHNGSMKLQGEDSVGATTVFAQLKDTASNFYNNNLAVVTMRAGGLQVKDSSGNAASLFYDSGTCLLHGDTLGTNITLRSRNTADTATNNMFAGDPDGAAELYNAGSKKFETTSEGVQVDSVLKMLERSSDPTEPAEGEAVIWMSDGTEKGDDGDVLIASKAGGATKWAVVFDHSAGAAW